MMKSSSCKNPMGKFVLALIDGAGLTVADFMREIGIAKVSKAIRRLDALVHDGELNPYLLAQIQSSKYRVPDEALHAVHEAHQRYLALQKEARRRAEEDYRRAHFYPHLAVIPELSRPTAISLFAVTGGNRRYEIRLPEEFDQWQEVDQLHWIKIAIRTAVERHKGRTAMMGRMMGYRYYFDFDRPPRLFDTEGELLAIDSDTFPVSGMATMTIRNRPGHPFSFG